MVAGPTADAHGVPPAARRRLVWVGGRCGARWAGGQPGLVSPRAAAASWPAWRTVKAKKIWEKPRNNAKNPTQNKIRELRWARAQTRSEPDTQNANSTSRIPVTRLTRQ